MRARKIYLNESKENKFVKVGDRQISFNYIKQLWNNLPIKTTSNTLHKKWFSKAKAGELTTQEWIHFKYLLEHGTSMYNDGKLSSKN